MDLEMDLGLERKKGFVFESIELNLSALSWDLR
jgi:hypothetical protein